MAIKVEAILFFCYSIIFLSKYILIPICHGLSRSRRDKLRSNNNVLKSWQPWEEYIWELQGIYTRLQSTDDICNRHFLSALLSPWKYFSLFHFQVATLTAVGCEVAVTAWPLYNPFNSLKLQFLGNILQNQRGGFWMKFSTQRSILQL